MHKELQDKNKRLLYLYIGVTNHYTYIIYVNIYAVSKRETTNNKEKLFCPLMAVFRQSPVSQCNTGVTKLLRLYIYTP